MIGAASHTGSAPMDRRNWMHDVAACIVASCRAKKLYVTPSRVVRYAAARSVPRLWRSSRTARARLSSLKEIMVTTSLSGGRVPPWSRSSVRMAVLDSLQAARTSSGEMVAPAPPCRRRYSTFAFEELGPLLVTQKRLQHLRTTSRCRRV